MQEMEVVADLDMGPAMGVVSANLSTLKVVVMAMPPSMRSPVMHKRAQVTVTKNLYMKEVMAMKSLYMKEVMAMKNLYTKEVIVTTINPVTYPHDTQAHMVTRPPISNANM